MESAHLLELPQKMMRLRARWEYGHLAGFILQLLGFCALVLSVLVDTPKDQRQTTIEYLADRRQTG